MNEFEIIKQLPKLEKREWSYLEKIGVSQRETIIAEILRYYFDPNEKHDLRDTFIKALLQTKPKYFDNKDKEIGSGYNKIQDSYYKAIQKIQNEDFYKESTTAEVEVVTFNNNRIDIVINTEKLVIAIEFKINHNLDNPLDDYVNFIKCKDNKKECSKYKNKDYYFVVLTPYWKYPDGKATKNNDFVQIILSKFIDNIIKLKKYKINSKQEIFYNDFINTITNRSKTINMIQDYFAFSNDNKNGTELEKIFENLNIIKKHLEKRSKALLKRLNEKYNNRFYIIKSSKDKLFSVISTKLKNNKELKIRFSVSGCRIEIWENGKRTNSIKEKNFKDLTFDAIEEKTEEIMSAFD